MPPTRRRKQQLTRDKNIQILAFWQIGMTYEAVAKLFHDVSSFQVEYLIQKGHSISRYVQLLLSHEFYLTRYLANALDNLPLLLMLNCKNSLYLYVPLAIITVFSGPNYSWNILYVLG
jgi:hypothetical protein